MRTVREIPPCSRCTRNSGHCLHRRAQPLARANRIAVPLILKSHDGKTPLSFLSTTTVFGTATDVTLAELTLECFYPADEETRLALLSKY